MPTLFRWNPRFYAIEARKIQLQERQKFYKPKHSNILCVCALNYCESAKTCHISRPLPTTSPWEFSQTESRGYVVNSNFFPPLSRSQSPQSPSFHPGHSRHEKIVQKTRRIEIKRARNYLKFGRRINWKGGEGGGPEVAVIFCRQEEIPSTERSTNK